jgi:chemotaxis protein MotB
MATFSDMMSLLLCFFVLIVAFSEIKKEEQYQAVVEEIQKAFGMKGGGGRLPTDEDPELSLIQKLVAQALYNNRQPMRSNNVDPGPQGRDQQVTIVRAGEQVAVGGRVFFEPGSSELTPAALVQLQQVAAQLKGKTNVVIIKGHTESAELLQRPDAPYEDLWALSVARARVVMDSLASPEVGIEPARLRRMALATTSTASS